MRISLRQNWYDLKGSVEEWLTYIRLKYSNVECLEINYTEKDEYDDLLTTLDTNILEKSMIEVLSKLTQLREYGCRICPVTKRMAETMNNVNKRLTSLRVWLEDLQYEEPHLRKFTDLGEGINYIQHLQVITIIFWRYRHYNDNESYFNNLYKAINEPLQCSSRQNVLHYDLLHWDSPPNSAAVFNILQKCPLVESVSVSFGKFGDFNGVFQEQHDKDLINNSNLKRLNLTFAYAKGDDDQDYQEFIEWLLQVCPLLDRLTLNGKVMDTESQRRRIANEV